MSVPDPMTPPAVTTRRRGWSTNWQFWLGLIVSLFFLWWVLSQVNDFGYVAAALANANYIYMLPALAVYFLGIAIRAVRWQVLLRPIQLMRSRDLFQVVVIGYMANDVLPARMGELVRAYVLNRDHRISKTATLGTIFVERVFDGITMLLFIAAVALFVPLGERLEGVVALAAVLLVAVAATMIVIGASPSRTATFVSFGLRIVPESTRPKVETMVGRFVSGLVVLQSGRQMLVVLGLSVLAWLCEATMYYLIGFSFALRLGFGAFTLTTAVANLGTMAPSSPGYVGTFEALVGAVLQQFAVEADQALSYTIALHAALLVPVTLLGFLFMWRRHVSLRQAQGEG